MRPAVPLLLAALLCAMAPSAAQDGSTDDPPVEGPTEPPRAPAPIDPAKTTGVFYGSLRWGDEGDGGEGAATWTLVDGRLRTYRATLGDVQYGCADGLALVRHANGTLESGTCKADGTEDAALHVHLIVQAPNGTVAYIRDGLLRPDPERSSVLEPPREADLWPGFALMLGAAGLAAAVAGLAWLYLRERRIARYLVRRLFETTHGEVPADWPPKLRRDVVARFLARGKN